MAKRATVKLTECPACGEAHDRQVSCLAAWLESLKKSGRREKKQKAMEAA